MARIEGVNLPESKRVEYGLTYIRGIGLFRSREILKRVNISLDKRIKDLTHEEVAAIQRDINGRYKVGGELQTEIANNIRVLQEIGSYRGLRHKKGLPVRGQRSKTNARTRKGPRRAGATVPLKRKITKK